MIKFSIIFKLLSGRIIYFNFFTSLWIFKNNFFNSSDFRGMERFWIFVISIINIFSWINITFEWIKSRWCLITFFTFWVSNQSNFTAFFSFMMFTSLNHGILELNNFLRSQKQHLEISMDNFEKLHYNLLILHKWIKLICP